MLSKDGALKDCPVGRMFTYQETMWVVVQEGPGHILCKKVAARSCDEKWYLISEDIRDHWAGDTWVSILC